MVDIIADKNKATARFNKQLCNLSNESKSQTVINYSTIVYVLAFTFVAMRMAGKYMSNKFAWNDIPVVAALLLAAIPISMVIVSKCENCIDNSSSAHLV